MTVQSGTLCSMSLENERNNRGPKPLPGGTPLRTVFIVKTELLI